MLPNPTQIDTHLLSILERGSVNLGAQANTERLMLMLTRSCQLRCGYCWVNKTETGTTMPAALAHQSIDFLMRSNRQKLEVQFFGGEPTSEWDVLYSAITYARNHPNRQQRNIEFVVTTNGLGLTPERVNQLAHPDTLILFSLDGDANSHRRFRPTRKGPGALSNAAAWTQISNAITLLNTSTARWFMNAVIPPADADGVFERYEWALQHAIPALQLNYAVGMEWPQERVDAYLSGLLRVLKHHQTNQPNMLLYNWKSDCEPVMLSDDLIVDVDGMVLHDGAIFLERGFPELRHTYVRGPLETLADFDACRWSLAKLFAVMCQTYPPDSAKHRTALQNIRMGAAVDFAIQRFINHP